MTIQYMQNKQDYDESIVLARGNYKGNPEIDCVFCGQIRILGLNFYLRSNSKKLIRALKRVFCLFNEPVVINSTINLVTQNILLYLIISDEIGWTRFISEIYNIVKQKNKEKLLYLHGAAVTLNRNCLIFLGECDSGKTTISSLLRENGARILGEDSAALNYESNRIFPFPTFSSIKPELVSNLQKQYKVHFSFFHRNYGRIDNTCLFSMHEKDFKIYYNYQYQFYELDKPYLNNYSKLFFIFIEDRIAKDAILEKLSHMRILEDYLRSFYIARSIEFSASSLKCALGIFSNINYYCLKRGTLQDTIGMILNEFS